VISRILENQLDGKFSISQIAETLRKVSCSPLDENWYLADYADEITDAINDKMGIDFNRKFLRLGDIKNILADTKKT
jgi:hypothetical protein